MRGNPAPYAGAVVLPGVEVVCASPELFLSRHGDLVTTGPIKGTAVTPEQLLPKDVDENVMIVDLARNDLSIVCAPGTVEVSELLAVEHHPGLVHLVSRVRGRLRPDVGWGALWSAVTPPASVTGAPKSSALRAIADLEPGPRGPYCGAVGWIDVDAGTAELAVGIRTFWTARRAGRRVLRFGAGAGHHLGLGPARRVGRDRAQGRTAARGGGRLRVLLRLLCEDVAMTDDGLRAWVNGALVEPGAPALAALDHGVTVGDGVFETLKVVDGVPFALTRHLRRLASSAAGLGLTPPDPRVIRDGLDEVLLAGDAARARSAAHHDDRRPRPARLGTRGCGRHVRAGRGAGAPGTS